MKLKENAVIFLHIPKTAGTTMRKIFEKLYGVEYVNSHLYNYDEQPLPDLIKDVKSLPENEKRKIKVLNGHAAYGMHNLLPQQSVYITFFRDPSERAISDYYHMERSAKHRSRIGAKDDITLEEFIKNGKTENMGVSYLASDDAVPVDINEGNKDALLARAKEHLRKIELIGIAEEFDKSIILMKRRLGWAMPLYIVRNKGGNRPPSSSISPELISLIKEKNSLDFDLYSYARSLFSERIKKEGAGFYFDLFVFKIVNRMYYYKEKIKGRLVKKQKPEKKTEPDSKN